MGDIVGRTDFIQKHAAVSIFAAMGHPDHRIAGVFVKDASQLRRNFRKGLILADGLEFSIRTALHRLPDPVFVVKIGGYAMSAGAKRAVIFHRQGMSFDFP